MAQAYHSGMGIRRSALTRADALSLWYNVTLGNVREDAPDLTARQLALLMTIYLEPAPHTVKSLSLHLDVTKAVITRALDTLGNYGLVDRARDPNDKRSVLVQRTAKGSVYLTQFADHIRHVRRDQTQAFSGAAA